jgi:hypothetical protein
MSNSLLTTQSENPSQRVARELLAAPMQTRDVLLNQLDDASLRLWSSADPAAVLAALGDKAASLFALNDQFGELVGALLASEGDSDGLARLAAINGRMLPLDFNEDGTVSLTA